MSRRGGSKRDDLPSPEDVLAGRVAPLPSVLMRVIHAVNPTGHELPSRERQRRYELKARLQSLLVQRHAEDLVVLPGSQEGVATLRHRHLDVDACHTVIAELHGDARSWVQYQLDVGAGMAEDQSASVVRARGSGDVSHGAHGREAAGARGGDTVEAARRALDEYDYDRARDLLAAAVRRDPGDARAAGALLELLVDTLGDDRTALDVAESLSGDCMQAPTVRLLLALAAARAGSTGQALELSRRLDHHRVGEVLAIVAERTLKDGDILAAERHLAALRQRGPSSEVSRLDRALAEERARRRAPEEKELLALSERGLTESVAKRAAALLDGDPGSAVARKIVSDWARLERSRRADALRVEVERVLERNDLAVARTLVRDPLWSLVAREVARPVEERLAALHDAERATATEAKVGAVCSLLDADLRRGLTAYAELDDERRALVRQRRDETALAWLDAMDGVRADLAIDAAHALRLAESLIEQDPARVLQALLPHAKELRAVRHATELRNRATEMMEARRRDQASSGLVEVLLAADSGNIAQAKELLARLDVKGLSARDRAELDSLRDQVARLDGLGRLAGEYEALLAESNPVEARRIARRLASAAEGAERERWTGIEERLGQDVATGFCLLVDDSARSLEVLRAFDWTRHEEAPVPWIQVDRQELVLADARGRWLFVWIVDLAARTVVRSIGLRTPEPLGMLDFLVQGDTLWLLGGDGAVLAFDLEQVEVTRWIPSSRLVRNGDRMERMTMAPPAFVWVTTRDPRDEWRIRVFDLEQDRYVREIPEGEHALFVPAPSEGRVLHTRGGTPELYLPGGKRTSELRPSHDFGAWSAAAVHPSGRGIVGLLSEEDAPEGSPGLLVQDPGATGAIVEIPHSDPVRISGIGTSLRARATYVHHFDDDGARSLARLGLEGERLVLEEQAPAPDRLVLVQDLTAQGLWALWTADDDVRWEELRGASQELAPLGEPFRRRLPVKHPHLFCAGAKGERKKVAQALLEGLSSPGSLARILEDFWERRMDEPETLIAFGLALHMARRYDEAREFDRRTWERHAQHPEVRMLRADERAKHGQWSEVLELLADVDPENLPSAYRGHFHHVLALAYLVAGDTERARNAVDRAQRHGPEDCELDDLLELADAADAPLVAKWEDVGRSAPGRILWAIRTADARLEAAEPRGALAALEHVDVLKHHEVQSAARRAEAYLALELGSTTDRLRKIHALATFCDAHDEGDSFRREMIVPRGAYSRERLDELSRRALQWLESVGSRTGRDRCV